MQKFKNKLKGRRRSKRTKIENNGDQRNKVLEINSQER